MCKRIKQILEEDLEFKVVGTALNGQEALVMAAQLEPDIITMDVEMPIMDGITAVKKIMTECPTPILMFSAATHAGAKATLQALEAGAIDFLPKQLDEIDGNQEMAKRLLRYRVRCVAQQAKRKLKIRLNTQSTLSHPVANINRFVPQYHTHSAKNQFELVVIVASTGGPVAIQKVLTRIPANCSFPVLLIQHMPHNFTKSFAERLDQLCQIKVKEAVNGDELKPGEALLAPGGMQMIVETNRRQKSVSIRKKSNSEIYSPCADITLSSLVQGFSNVLTIVLTGMGADGKEGVIELKRKGFLVWAQNEASCTIYGMPKAIVDANLADKIYSLDEIANELGKLR